MNVSNVTSTGNNPYASSYQTNFGQGLRDFKSLAEALQSGSLSKAQSAFSSLEQDLPGLSQLLQANSSSSSASSQNGPIATALKSLQSALQSGDLTGAQQAFASLQKDLQGVGLVRGHHHHHHTSGTNGSAAANRPASDPDLDGDSDGSKVAPNGQSATSLLNAQA